MENGWNLFNFSNSSTNFGKVHNSGNCTNTSAAWEDVSESGIPTTTSRFIINSHHSFLSTQQSLMLADDRGNYFPDPHLMCLKLGKRHYYGDVANYSIPTTTKKGKPYYHYYHHDDGGILVDDQRPSTAAPPVPRCQVDGCNAVLVNAKDYHRRHKVCEIHSKAPKVSVLGLEQRFCQQCSRQVLHFIFFIFYIYIYIFYSLH